jgi:hypothetical protein
VPALAQLVKSIKALDIVRDDMLVLDLPSIHGHGRGGAALDRLPGEDSPYQTLGH